jgi:transposase
MAGRGRPGPAPQAAKREQFARLIARGVSNSEACRIVGVNRRTGKRWRHGRTMTSSSGVRLHYPPVIGARKAEISPRYLSEDERVSIADLRRGGLGVRAIAGELGRCPSTVSRELRRNREPSSGQYRPFAAQRLAAGRGARPGHGKLAGDPVLRRFVADRLESGGARSRSARRCAPSSPAIPGGIWCTRRSTRRSTARGGAGCAGTCPGCCARDGGVAGRGVARTRAGLGR